MVEGLGHYKKGDHFLLNQILLVGNKSGRECDKLSPATTLSKAICKGRVYERRQYYKISAFLGFSNLLQSM